MQWGHRGRGWGGLTWRWHTQGSLNLLSKIKNEDWSLRERGMSSSFGSQMGALFSQWPTTQGGRWGSIYSPPPQKESLGGFPSDKSGEATKQVQWTSLESGVRPLEAGHWSDKSGPLDKSDDGLWNLVEWLWNPVTDRTSPVGLSEVRSRVSGIRWIH
jgi:hypothetical protein